MNQVEVKYYAGIADRIGRSEETYEGAATAAELVEQIVARHGESVRPSLAACSFLSTDGRLEGQDRITGGLNVDVLPPFAGG